MFHIEDPFQYRSDTIPLSSNPDQHQSGQWLLTCHPDGSMRCYGSFHHHHHLPPPFE